MKFADLRAGETIFIDANPLVDHFSANPKTGLACRALIGRITAKEISALTSAHIVAEMAHRLMTIEACAVFGWPYKGIAQKLASHPTEVRHLTGFRQAVEAVSTVGIQILPILPHHLTAAADVVQQHGLLFNDALAVAIMQSHGIVNLASNDADFDQVPGIVRYAPD